MPRHRVPVLLFTMLVCAQSACAAVAYRTILLSGQELLPAGNGVTAGTFGSPTINDAGEVMFGASLQGPGIDITNDSSSGLLVPTGCIWSPASLNPPPACPSALCMTISGTSAMPGPAMLHSPGVSAGQESRAATTTSQYRLVLPDRSNRSPGRVTQHRARQAHMISADRQKVHSDSRDPAKRACMPRFVAWAMAF
jgi:hypothetical protein